MSDAADAGALLHKLGVQSWWTAMWWVQQCKLWRGYPARRYASIACDTFAGLKAFAAR